MVQSFRLAQRYFCLPTNIRGNGRWVVVRTRSGLQGEMDSSFLSITRVTGIGRGRGRGPHQCWFPSSPPSKKFMLEVGIFGENRTVLPLLPQERFIARYTRFVRELATRNADAVTAVLPYFSTPSLPALPAAGSTAHPQRHTAEAFRPRSPRRKITLHCAAQQR